MRRPWRWSGSSAHRRGFLKAEIDPKKRQKAPFPITLHTLYASIGVRRHGRQEVSSPQEARAAQGRGEEEETAQGGGSRRSRQEARRQGCRQGRGPRRQGQARREGSQAQAGQEGRPGGRRRGRGGRG